jgi:hypothetical protein
LIGWTSLARLSNSLAGVDDYEIAEATWLAAVKRWPRERIILRQAARVVRDSRQPHLAWPDKGRQGEGDAIFAMKRRISPAQPAGAS